MDNKKYFTGKHRRFIAILMIINLVSLSFSNVYATESMETEQSESCKTEETEMIASESSECEGNDIDTTESDISESEGTEIEESKASESEDSWIEVSETETSETIETETVEADLEESSTMTEEQTNVAELIDELQSEIDRQFNEDGYVPSGYIDSGFEADCVLQNSEYKMNTILPQEYSSVEKGQASSIKNQGAWGTCWAFSVLAIAENFYKKFFGTEADLSESHLVNFFYHEGISGPDGGLDGDKIIPLMTSKVMQGGNGAFTTFAMSRWTGIADEAVDESLVYPLEASYNTKELEIDDAYAYTDVLHMQNAYWINKADTESIKRAVMENGAISIYYKYSKNNDSRYVNNILEKFDKPGYDGPAVYYYQPMSDEQGHGVAIVGWDDNFDKNNFAYTFINQQDVLAFGSEPHLPQNNGAWLVKNSWGTEYGDDGYFWMSYEDASLSDTIYAFDFERADNYDHIYQYDGSAGTKYECGEQITAAAIYKSNGNQLLEAVGVGIASVETDYKIDIYKSLADGNNPQSGQLAAVTQGHTTFQGYHTIKLDDSVILSEGEVFGVVVTLSNGMVNKESGSAIFMDKTYDNGSSVRFVAKSNPGETFIKKDGQWEDIYEEGTFRIKAYTGNYDFEIPQENISLTSQMVQEIEDQEYSGTINEPDIVIGYMGERLIQNVDYIVNYVNNDHVADRDSENAPRVIITGTGKYTGVVEQTFTIVPKVITEEMIENTSFMYNGNLQNDLVIANGMARLVKDKDYSITYDKQPCNVGTYQAQIVGKDNYSGTLNVPVTIVNTMLTEDMITVPEAVEYTGKSIKPQVTVSVGGADIPASGFTVSFKNNINVGTATVTVSGKGNCQGKVQKSFQIVPKDISKGLEIAVAKVSYTGKAVTPKVTVKCNGRTLRKGTDFNIAYGNNIVTGENAVITVDGKGNYRGSFEQNFVILPKELGAGNIKAELGYFADGCEVNILVGKDVLSKSEYDVIVYKSGTSNMVDESEIVLGEKYDLEVVLKGNYRIKNAGSIVKKNIICRKSVSELNVVFENNAENYYYNGKAHKPKVMVKDSDGMEVSKSNYSILYANNINAGTANVIVTGKGVYSGTKTMEFTIQKYKLTNLTIQPVRDQTYSQKEICPDIKVMDGSKVLKCGSDKDYICIYGNNKDVCYEGASIIPGAYVDIQFSDNYDVAQNISTRVYFRILPAKLSKVTVSKAYYTGQAVVPDSIVVNAGKLKVSADSYTVEADNNIQVSGRAVLSIKAKPQSNYTGILNKKYNIVKRELKSLILPEIPDLPYLGIPVDVSGYMFRQQNGELVDSSEYTMTVKNNTKPGKATVTYKAKSNSIYRGSVSIKFNIVKGTIRQAIDKENAKMLEKPYTGEAITLTDEEIIQLAPIKAYTGVGNPPYMVSYVKNVNAGQGVLKLTGKDYLYGSVLLYFKIIPKSVSSLNIETGDKQLSYNAGNPVYLELKKVTDGDKELKSGKDYIYSYTNADKKGTACLTVTGVGNYTGTRYIYYKIES